MRVDAAPGVEVPGGSFVTVESGPHQGLDAALHALQHPKPRVRVALAGRAARAGLVRAVPSLRVSCGTARRRA